MTKTKAKEKVERFHFNFTSKNSRPSFGICIWRVLSEVAVVNGLLERCTVWQADTTFLAPKIYRYQDQNFVEYFLSFLLKCFLTFVNFSLANFSQSAHSVNQIFTTTVRASLAKQREWTWQWVAKGLRRANNNLVATPDFFPSNSWRNRTFFLQNFEGYSSIKNMLLHLQLFHFMFSNT